MTDKFEDTVKNLLKMKPKPHDEAKAKRDDKGTEDETPEKPTER